MSPFSADLLERANDALSMVPERERSDAARVAAVCSTLSIRPRNDGERLIPGEGDPALRVELSRLAELLGRRSSAALPFAALARAALADLAADPRGRSAGLASVEQHLSMLGL
jgi:hypothetical protein